MAENSVYVVCDACGFFHGDMRLHANVGVVCPECGSEAGWAFAKLEKALEYQHHHEVRAASPEGGEGG